MTPKQIAEKWFDELWNRKNSDYILEVTSPDVVAHFETIVTDGAFAEKVGQHAIVEFHQNILNSFPAIKCSVINSLGDDNDACILWEVEATPDGAKTAFKFRGMTWFHFEDGKIVEGWDAWNEGGVMNALNA